MNQDYNFFFWLSVVANVLQIENYRMLLKDATNNDILKKIIEQNEEILKK